MQRAAALGFLVAVLACGACGDNKTVTPPMIDAPPLMPPPGQPVWRQVVTTQGSAILVTAPAGDTRQFVIEQEGRIRIIDKGVYQDLNKPFLDISGNSDGPVLCCGEQGLLGLAFHPDYANNRQFFVSYTAANLAPNHGDDLYVDVIVRYTTKANDPDHADPASATPILAIPDFAVNHNGGMLEFGPDGFLYLGTGDGGKANDPNSNGQNPNALLGKILRIDVDHPSGGRPYGIPADNPFAAGGGAPEVFILGTRNPWRWTFDKQTGDMWIGDVGQDTIEELDYLPAGHQAGANLGWSTYEGLNCFHGPCDSVAQTEPVFFKTHAQGWCSTIGGQVYRGATYPSLIGTYVFTDYCAHTMNEAKVQADGSVQFAEVPATMIQLDGQVFDQTPGTPSSLHDDGTGELFLTTVTCCGTSATGAVWKLELADPDMVMP